jgi:hypothetical protein
MSYSIMHDRTATNVEARLLEFAQICFRQASLDPEIMLDDD